MYQRTVPYEREERFVLNRHGYFTLSLAAIKSFFTTITAERYQIGNYLVKLYTTDHGSYTLIDSRRRDEYDETEERLDDFFKSEFSDGGRPKAPIYRTDNGSFMCCACSEGIIAGYCRSRDFDEIEILIFCMFSICELNGKDPVLRRACHYIQKIHGRTINFSQAMMMVFIYVYAATKAPSHPTLVPLMPSA